MKLTVSTPLAVAIEADDVSAVRAEDDSGCFGILPGHADFLTALSVSVLTWRDGRGAEHHVALRGGVLDVRGGTHVAVATREAICGDDLAQLEDQVLAEFHRRQAEEQAARTDAQKLYLAAVRQIMRSLRPEQGGHG